MKRGQISLDFLFAITLITLTMVNVVYIANSERAHSETFDTVTKLKAFSIDIRDTVVKVYSSGDGFSVRKGFPIELGEGDRVNVSLITPNSLIVNASIGQRSYIIVQQIPIILHENSSVILTRERTEFVITADYDETEGRLDVVLSS